MHRPTVRRRIHAPFGRGSSLIEVLGAVAVSTVMFSGIYQELAKYGDNLRDTHTAEQLYNYAQAARSYVRENKVSLLKQTAVMAVPTSSLIQYLPGGVQQDNAYGQTPCLVLKGEGNRVTGYLVFQGGRPVDSSRRASIGMMGRFGAGVVDDAGVPRGPGWSATDYKTWSAGLCKPTAGRVAYSLALMEPPDLPDDRYLCRQSNVQGCLNTMESDIDMGGKNITSLSQVTPPANQSLVVSGSVNVSQALAVSGVARMGTLAVSGVAQVGTLEVSGTTTLVGNLAVKDHATFQKNLTVSGTLQASTMLSTLSANSGDSCATSSIGALAKASDGRLLFCGKDASGVMRWTLTFEAREEKSFVVGCYYANAFCGNYYGAPANTVINDNGNDGYGATYMWTATIGERSFCALGMEAMGPSSSGGSTPWAVRTFCRVFPSGTGPTGKSIWYIRVGSWYRTPIACHAVCLQ